MHYVFTIPLELPTPGTPVYLSDIGEEVVGITVNGILIDSHDPTWSYDGCNGHSDTNHQYHYHIPPFCLSNALNATGPSAFDWWVDNTGNYVASDADKIAAFPTTGTRVLMGWARDGFPIYNSYDANGDLQTNSTLDECNGKGEGDEYAYYFTPDAPYAPTCLRGDIGSFTYWETDQKCPSNGISTTVYEECDSASFSDYPVSDCTTGATTTSTDDDTTDDDDDDASGDPISGAAEICTATTIVAGAVFAHNL